MAGKGDYASLGASVGNLELASKDRLEDAVSLRTAGRYSIAISMGLYALEIQLKVQICKPLELDRLPKPFEIHDLEGLLILSGLSRALTKKNARPAKSNRAEIVKTAAGLNELRYQPHSFKGLADSDKFFSQLLDPINGVMAWISTRP